MLGDGCTKAADKSGTGGGGSGGKELGAFGGDNSYPFDSAGSSGGKSLGAPSGGGTAISGAEVGCCIAVLLVFLLTKSDKIGQDWKVSCNLSARKMLTEVPSTTA